MKVLIDTNVILDLLLDRPPFSEDATRLLSALERQGAEIFIPATSITTIYYIARKFTTRHKTRKQLSALLSSYSIAGIDGPILERALGLSCDDYEDAVIMEAASTVGADAIITRDAKGFRAASISVFSPRDFLTLLEAKAEGDS